MGLEAIPVHVIRVEHVDGMVKALAIFLSSGFISLSVLAYKFSMRSLEQEMTDKFGSASKFG
jgi:hypothetical protein